MLYGHAKNASTYIEQAAKALGLLNLLTAGRQEVVIDALEDILSDTSQPWGGPGRATPRRGVVPIITVWASASAL